MRLTLLLTLAVSSLPAQTEIPAGTPVGYTFDGGSAEWAALPPTFALHVARPGGRAGSIWVRQTPQGLLIAGKVAGPAPDFAAADAAMTRQDHVEVWIAPEEAPRFPAIGWTHHLSDVTLGSVDDCRQEMVEEKPCREWFPKVAPYRQRLARLFVRQYGMSPALVMEAFATPANARAGISALAPKGKPAFRAAVDPAGGYSFETLVPWEAFPPLDTLELSRLRLMVDVFSAHRGAPRDQPYSSTSAARKYGDPETMNLVSFAAPHRFQAGSCEYPLPDHEAHFLPGEGKVMAAFTLENYARAYQYAPEADSPIVKWNQFFEKPIPGDAILCGPVMAYHREGVSRQYQFEIDKDHLDARLQPDGSYLVMSGPRIDTPVFVMIGGAGCGACPNILLEVFSLAKQGELKRIYKYEDQWGNPFGSAEGDLHISPDWKQITSYSKRVQPGVDDDPGHWQSESQCLQGGAYVPCGSNKNSPAPKPSGLKF